MSEQLRNHEDHEPFNEEIHEEYIESPEAHEVPVTVHHEVTPEYIEPEGESAPEAPIPSSEDLKKIFTIKDVAEPLPPAGKEVKETTKATNLSVARARLNKSEQSFSRFVHAPKISALSEVTGKTLIRPSAILCGGIFTLFGSFYYLFITHQTGYKYNFFVAITLFIGGFIVGLILEFLYRIVLTRS